MSHFNLLMMPVTVGVLKVGYNCVVSVDRHHISNTKKNIGEKRLLS